MHTAAPLPAFVAIPWHEYERETHPRLKLWATCEAYELAVRFSVMTALAELRALPEGDVRLDAALLKISPTIEGPTLAGWLGMLTELMQQLHSTDPLVVPEWPTLAATLAAMAPLGATELGQSLLIVRNTLAHGGAVTTTLAERLLEEWDARFGALRTALACFASCQLVWFADGTVRQLNADGSLGSPVPRPAGLHVPSERRVLLLRENRGLDLWPLCDYTAATMTVFATRTQSATPAPQMFFRAEKRRLLYAALGCELPIHQSADHLAAFRAFFRLDRPSEKTTTVLDFANVIATEASDVCGRHDELATLKKAVKETACGVLWVDGPGGIGKSYLLAKFAHQMGNANQFSVVFWRFRAGDAERCHRYPFLRHAIRTLSQPKLGHARTPLVPATDPAQLLPQFLDLLRDAHARNPQRRVLLILDGLDEIARSDADLVRALGDWHFGHAVWLCAGRSEGDIVPEVFAATRCRHVFPGGLPGLTTAEIRALIDARLGGRLRELLRHDEDAGTTIRNRLVDAIAERANGLPLYVHFVCEDLLAGQLPLDGTLPAKLPASLAQYYDDLLRRRGIKDLDTLKTPLIVLIAWAFAPLDTDILRDFLQRWRLLPRDRAKADELLGRGLDCLQAMLRPVALAEGRVGYELYHLTFRDHVRQDEGVSVAAETARDLFREGASEWATFAQGGTMRNYLLRHGPAHLLHAAKPTELAELARDRAFLRAQVTELPQEPEAPQRTLEQALRCATRASEAALMAEFALRYHFRRAEAPTESPVEALHKVGLTRAKALAKLTANPANWYFLLAWELMALERLDEARQVLGEVPKRLAVASQRGGSQASLKGRSLAFIPGLDPREIDALLGSSLGEERDAWLRAIVDQGGSDAVWAANQINDTDQAAQAFLVIACQFVDNGGGDYAAFHQIPPALQVQALDHLQNAWEESPWYGYFHKLIAFAQRASESGDELSLLEALGVLEAGDPTTAAEVAERLNEPALQIEVWLRIAAHYVVADERSQARDWLVKARARAEELGDPELCAHVQVAGACVCWRANQAATAQSLIRQALAYTDDLAPDDSLRTRIVVEVTDALLEFGREDDLVAIIKELAEGAMEAVTTSDLADEALVEVMEKLDRAGKYDAARVAAKWVLVGREIRNQELSKHAQAMLDVVNRLAREGEFATAQVVAKLFGLDELRGLALRVVAVEQAKWGLPEDAIQLAETLMEAELRPLAFAQLALVFAMQGDGDRASAMSAIVVEDFATLGEPFATTAQTFLTAADIRLGQASASLDEQCELIKAIAQIDEIAVQLSCWTTLAGVAGPLDPDAQACYRQRAFELTEGLDNNIPQALARTVIAAQQHDMGEELGAIRETLTAAVDALYGLEWRPFYETLAYIARVAADLGVTDLAHEWLAKARDCLKLAIDGGHDEGDTLDLLKQRVAQALAAVGEEEAALQLIEGHYQVEWSGLVWARLVGHRCRRGDRDGVREMVANVIESVRPRYSTLQAIVHYLAASGDADTALKLWDYRDGGHRELALALVAASEPHQREAGLRSLAVVAQRFESSFVNQVFTVAIKLLQKGAVPAAKRVLRWLDRDDQHRFGLVAARLYWQVGDEDAARQALAAELATVGDESTILAIAALFEQIGAFDAAQNAVALAIRINAAAVVPWAVAKGDDATARAAEAASLGPPLHPDDPLKVVYRAQALYHAGSLELAIKEWFSSNNSSSRTYDSTRLWKNELVVAIRRFLVALPSERHVELADAVRQALRQPNPSDPEGFLTMAPGLEGVLAWAGDVEGALTECQRLRGSERVIAYAFIFDAPKVAADPHVTREVLAAAIKHVSAPAEGEYESLQNMWDADCWILIGTIHFQLGDPEAGGVAFDRAVQCAQNSGLCEILARTTLSAADVYTKCGRLEQAVALHRRIELLVDQPNALHSYDEIGCLMEIASAWHTQANPTVPTLFARALRVSEATANYFSRGNVKLLIEYHVRSILKIMTPNLSEFAKAQEATLTATGLFQIRRGDREGALQTAQRIVPPQSRSFLEGKVVQSYLAQGALERAHQVAEKIYDPCEQCRWLAQVGVAQTKAGLMMANATLAAATALVEMISHHGYESGYVLYYIDSAYCSLACAYAELRDFTRVEELFSALSGQGDQNSFLSAVTKSLAQSAPDEALLYAVRCSGYDRTEALLVVREAFLARGMPDGAARAEAELPDSERKKLSTKPPVAVSAHPNAAQVDGWLDRAERQLYVVEAQDDLLQASEAAVSEDQFRRCLALLRRLALGSDLLASNFGDRAFGAGYFNVAAEYFLMGGKLSDLKGDREGRGYGYYSPLPELIEGLAQAGAIPLLEEVLLAPSDAHERLMVLLEGIARAYPERASAVAEVVANADVVFFGG